MDGLAGIVYPDVYQMTGRIKPMLEIQKHRGSGKALIHTHRNIEVGVASGHLGFNEKKSVCVGFDGFLENIDTLAEELKAKGCIKGALDDNNFVCKLISASYEEFGDTFASKLKGDFALFVYDEKDGSILLVRDRIGKKPLYWYQDSQHFIFGSEMKALLITGLIPKTVAPDSFASYLYLGYIPQDLSPIKGMSKLLPGHFLKLKKDGSITILPYWSLSDYFMSPQKHHVNYLVKSLDHHLLEATKEMIPEEGLLQCCLSGGLGSSSVAHYIRKSGELKRALSLTATFKEVNPEDNEAAQDVAEALDIPHFSKTITPDDFLNEYPLFAWHLDEPLADQSSFLSWTLAKMVKEHAGAGPLNMFTGMGSDEQLMGHSRYTSFEHGSSRLKILSDQALSAFFKALLPIATFFRSSLSYDLLRRSRKNSWQTAFLEENALFSKELMSEAAPDFVELFDPDVFLSKFHKISKISSPVSSFLYFDMKTRLADDFLLQFERSTSAFGINFYTPFLDQSVIEFCATLPNPSSIDESGAFFLLKSIMQKVYPEAVINRPKRTRPNFLQSWACNPGIRELFTSLQTSHLVDLGMINPEWLKEAMRTDELCKKNFRWLFALVCFEAWYKLFIMMPLETSPPNINLKQLLLNR